MVNSEFSVVGRRILADPCVVHTLKHMRTASENSLQNQDGTLIFQCASGGPWSTGLLTLAYGSGSVENVNHHIPSKRTCAQLGPWLPSLGAGVRARWGTAAPRRGANIAPGSATASGRATWRCSSWLDFPKGRFGFWALRSFFLPMALVAQKMQKIISWPASSLSILASFIGYIRRYIYIYIYQGYLPKQSTVEPRKIRICCVGGKKGTSQFVACLLVF